MFRYSATEEVKVNLRTQVKVSTINHVIVELKAKEKVVEVTIRIKMKKHKRVTRLLLQLLSLSLKILKIP